MPDREHDELQRELKELGSRIEYPRTPDVARTVRRRLDEEHAGRRRRGGLRALATPRWAAAAIIVLLSLTALSPAVRSIVSVSMSSGGGGGGQAAGGGGQAAGGAASSSSASSAEYAPEATHQPGREEASDLAAGGAAGGGGYGGSSPTVRQPASDLGLGEEVSASEARARVGRLLTPQTPELAGGPATIYAGGPSARDGVVVVFLPGPGLPPLGATDAGLLLAEAAGDMDAAYPVAGGADGPPPEEVDVGGNRGYWLPEGRSLRRSQPGELENLPGGALLWEQGGVALLMRADVTREEAVRIAGTIR